MRAHGVSNFPDPDSKGNILISPNARIDPGSPRYQAADRACAKLRLAAAGGGMTPAQQARAFSQLERLVQCLRTQGIPMPDPFKGPGGVGYALPHGIDPASARYEKAQNACKRFVPSGG